MPPTAVEELRKARQIGLDEGLQYVYTGNVPGDAGEKTKCPNCSHSVVDRVGYSTRRYDIKDGACVKCGYRIEGVEM